MVTARNIREKLSKQLKIDLERHERVKIVSAEPLPSETLNDESALDALIDEAKTDEDCTVQLQRLGDYVAKISLRGGFSVPLKFSVLAR